MEIVESVKNLVTKEASEHPYLASAALLATAAAATVLAKPLTSALLHDVKIGDAFIEGESALTLMSPASTNNALIRAAKKECQKLEARQLAESVSRTDSFSFKNQPETKLPETLRSADENGGKLEIPVSMLWKRHADTVSVQEHSWLAQTYDTAKNTVFKVETKDGKHMGSGFFSSEEGHFFSARHVFELSGNGNIRLADGTTYPFRILAQDSNADVGLAKVIAPEDKRFDFLKLGKPAAVESRRAAAIGYPGTEPYSQPIISPGKIRGLSYGDDATVYFSMNVKPGNSGGPIIGRDREVLSLVQSGNEPTHIKKGHWIPGKAHGPSPNHLQALMDVHAEKGSRTDDILRIRSRVREEDTKPPISIMGDEFNELMTKPNRISRLARRFKVEIKHATYWKDLD